MRDFLRFIASLVASCAVASAQAMPQITDITPPGRPYDGLGGPAIANVFMSDVAVHPLDPDRLIALDNGSVRLSSDGGKTWRSPDGAPAGRLFVHPGRPGTLFMFSDGTRRAGLGIFRWGGQLWRSNDFGESWEAMTRGY